MRSLTYIHTRKILVVACALAQHRAYRNYVSQSKTACSLYTGINHVFFRHILSRQRHRIGSVSRETSAIFVDRPYQLARYVGSQRSLVASLIDAGRPSTTPGATESTLCQNDVARISVSAA